MTDLEITQLCAKALKLRVIENNDPYLMVYAISQDAGGISFHYDPLHDDVQAMSLIKEFKLYAHVLSVDQGHITNTYADTWFVTHHPSNKCSANIDLNRAVVECVAKMQQEKQK